MIFEIYKKVLRFCTIIFKKYLILIFLIFVSSQSFIHSKHFSALGKYEKTNINICLEAWEKGTVYDEEIFEDGFRYKILYINYSFNFFKLKIDEEISSDSGPLMNCTVLVDY